MEPQNLDPERLDLFNGALNALLATLQPTPESEAARKQVVSDMQQLVSTPLPAELHCGVETFGSFRAGLHLPDSDLDFALTGWITQTATPLGDARCDNDDMFGTPPKQQQQQQPDRDRGAFQGSDHQQQQQRWQQQQQPEQLELHQLSRAEQECLLQDLADALEEHGLVQGQVECVLTARVPVIKFTHNGTGLHCDFSISRPECAFKAEMQKLLGSLDRRYGALLRIVKTWACAHGLNDAASSTLNSWSWGLMVAFYMQCEQPAILPPVWQLLHPNSPSPRSPRILQNPNITSAELKRSLNLAATLAGAHVTRRSRNRSSEAQNPKTLAELLLGFFEFFGRQMAKWIEGGKAKGCRASCWWGRWVDAPWPPGKSYIFSVEDPFKADDNTARSVGTRNILSCLTTASYIAWSVKTSAQLIRQALAPAAAAADGGSSQQICAAYCWLFGPAAVFHPQQQQVLLPVSLHDWIHQQIPQEVTDLVTQDVTILHDCSISLADSSSISCANSRNSSATDQCKIDQIRHAVELFKQVLQCLNSPITDVCLADYHVIYRQQQELLAEQREQQRQRKQQRQVERLQQRLHKQQQYSDDPDQEHFVRQHSAPDVQQQQQQQKISLTDQHLQHSKSGGAAVERDAAAAAAAAAVEGLDLGSLPLSSTAAAAAGGNGRRRAKEERPGFTDSTRQTQDFGSSSSSSGGSSRANGGSSSGSRSKGTGQAPKTAKEWFDVGSPQPTGGAAAGRGRGRGRSRGRASVDQLQISFESMQISNGGSSSSRAARSTSIPDRSAQKPAAVSSSSSSGVSGSSSKVKVVPRPSKQQGRGRGRGRALSQQQQQQQQQPRVAEPLLDMFGP